MWAAKQAQLCGQPGLWQACAHAGCNAPCEHWPWHMHTLHGHEHWPWHMHTLQGHPAAIVRTNVSLTATSCAANQPWPELQHGPCRTAHTRPAATIWKLYNQKCTPPLGQPRTLGSCGILSRITDSVGGSAAATAASAAASRASSADAFQPRPSSSSPADLCTYTHTS